MGRSIGCHYMELWICMYFYGTGTQWIPARCVCPSLHHAQDQRQYPHADVEEQWLKQLVHMPPQWLKQLVHMPPRELEFLEMTSPFKDFIYLWTSGFYTYLNVRTWLENFETDWKGPKGFSKPKSWPCTRHPPESQHVSGSVVQHLLSSIRLVLGPRP